jgi:hypothetical protein
MCGSEAVSRTTGERGQTGGWTAGRCTSMEDGVGTTSQTYTAAEPASVLAFDTFPREPLTRRQVRTPGGNDEAGIARSGAACYAKAMTTIAKLEHRVRRYALRRGLGTWEVTYEGRRDSFRDDSLVEIGPWTRKDSANLKWLSIADLGGCGSHFTVFGGTGGIASRAAPAATPRPP